MAIHRELPARLRAARLRARLSQYELSDRSGIAVGMLSRYENGHVMPSIDTIARIAQALSMTAGALIDGVPHAANAPDLSPNRADRSTFREAQPARLPRPRKSL